LFHAAELRAQEKMSVASFEMDEKDLTANLAGTKVLDPQDGKPCALIKVETTEHGFSFDCGMVHIWRTVEQNAEHPSEIWLYVEAGAMTITIQHPVLGKIEKYDMKGRLKSAKTYKMRLTTQQVNTFVFDVNKHQYLDLTIWPTTAQVNINGLTPQLDAQGRASIQLSFGQYRLMVKAQDYHTVEQNITIDNLLQRQSLSVRLKPAYGWLTIPNNEQLRGAELFIDGARIGVAPFEKRQMSSGPHDVTLRKAYYKDYTERVTISDSAITTLQPRWDVNYADVKISVHNDPEVFIYANDSMLSLGDWSGRLIAGTYRLEARKKNHQTMTDMLEVNPGEPRSVALKQPTPIYGTLSVKTTPTGASVIVDGKPVGTTPFTGRDILIGAHKVKMELKGHKAETVDVTVKEGETTQVDRKLTDFCNAVLRSTPQAQIYLNERNIGVTPYRFTKEAGTYQLRLVAKGYLPYENKSLRLDGATSDMDIHLKWDYFKRRQVYAQVGYSVLGCAGPTVAVGGYLYNVNLEASYTYSTIESGTLYWSDPSNEWMAPQARTYKPSLCLALKAGYGFGVGTRVRLTPQVGVQDVRITENTDDTEVVTPCSMMSLTGGVRVFVAVAHHWGVSLTPTYMLYLWRSKGAYFVSEQSTEIKALGEGFNANMSINFFF
jgi:hypothetical protein